MTVLVGIAYLLGKVLQQRKFEDWAKKEFLQVIISAALVGGLVFLFHPTSGALITVFNGLIGPETHYVATISGAPISYSSSECGLTGIEPNTVMCFAVSYLTALSGLIANVFSTIFTLNFVLDLLSKLSFDVIVIEITPLSGLNSVVQVFNTIMQSLVFLGVTVGVEIALMKFIHSVGLTVLLPIGVVLRCFFATRRIGGALMAIAIGLYVVFPLAISLNGLMAGEAFDDSIALIEKTLNDVNAVSPASIYTNSSAILNPEAWMDYFGRMGTNIDTLSDDLKQLPAMYFDLISSLVVQIIFLPFLSLMITVIAIKELAMLFGAEISLGKFEV